MSEKVSQKFKKVAATVVIHLDDATTQLIEVRELLSRGLNFGCGMLSSPEACHLARPRSVSRLAGVFIWGARHLGSAAMPLRDSGVNEGSEQQAATVVRSTLPAVQAYANSKI